MSEVPFHLTRAGARFYEHHVPAFLRELERLNVLLERLAGRLEEQELERPAPALDPDDITS